MAAANAFLTQVSTRAWRCSECSRVFVSDQGLDLDRMLDRFVRHTRQAHRGEEGSFGAGVHHRRGLKDRTAAGSES